MSDLRQGLKQTTEFFAPENLATLLLKYEGEVALLVIDVQKQFCDPRTCRGNRETKAISHRIKSLVPEFRKLAIPVYAVYYSAASPSSDLKLDFYQFKPSATDTLILKHTDSAFASSNIKDILKKDNKKLLLVCGFNRSACVKSTVEDACQQGFKVCLLNDLIGNDNHNGPSDFHGIVAMQKAGAMKVSSQAVLDSLPGLKN